MGVNGKEKSRTIGKRLENIRKRKNKYVKCSQMRLNVKLHLTAFKCI